jgi:hypothetical protein
MDRLESLSMAVFYSLPWSPPMVSIEFVTVRGKFDSGNCFLIATGPRGFFDCYRGC